MTFDSFLDRRAEKSLLCLFFPKIELHTKELMDPKKNYFFDIPFHKNEEKNHNNEPRRGEGEEGKNDFYSNLVSCKM